MSCWVTPTVAAEYWGVTLDVVWDRIQCDLVPTKSERGFIFIDVHPWTPEFTGRQVHQPPPTFVPAAGLDLSMPTTSGTLLRPPPLDAAEHAFLCADLLSDDEASFLGQESVEVNYEGDLDSSNELAEESEELTEESEELPELDEEESATFGRLSWRDVRQSVSRTRRPPPRAA
jgi:hypothetical protein